MSADRREDTYDPVAKTYWDTADEYLPAIEMHGLYRFLQFLARPVFSMYFQIEVVHGERIPEAGPVILAASHRSNIDTPFLGIVTRRPVNFMAKQEFFKSQFTLRVFRRLGAFPVNREAPDKRALERALETLEAGGVLGIYPEGQRRSGPYIRDVQRGPAWIAAHSGAPVVPVGIGGSAQVQPKGASKIRPAKVRMVVGEPLDPPTSRSRSALQAFTDEMVGALQAAFDEAGGEGPLQKLPRAEYDRGW